MGQYKAKVGYLANPPFTQFALPFTTREVNHPSKRVNGTVNQMANEGSNLDYLGENPHLCYVMLQYTINNCLALNGIALPITSWEH